MTPDRLLDYLDEQVRKLQIEVIEIKEQLKGIKKQDLHEEVRGEIDYLLANKTDPNTVKAVKDYIVSVLERSKE